MTQAFTTNQSEVFLDAQAPFTQDAEHLATRTCKLYMEHTAVNGSVHTGCKQHKRVCTQISAQIHLSILCEWGLSVATLALLQG